MNMNMKKKCPYTADYRECVSSVTCLVQVRKLERMYNLIDSVKKLVKKKKNCAIDLIKKDALCDEDNFFIDSNYEVDPADEIKYEAFFKTSLKNYMRHKLNTETYDLLQVLLADQPNDNMEGLFKKLSDIKFSGRKEELFKLGILTEDAIFRDKHSKGIFNWIREIEGFSEMYFYYKKSRKKA